MRKKTLVPEHFELGNFLSTLQDVIFIDGKRLSDAKICHRTSLSPKIYVKVKRA